MAPKFSEYVLFSSVKESAPAGMVEELARAAKKYEQTEGVLSLDVGYAEPVFGNSSFVFHIRGRNEAALDSLIAKFRSDPIVGPDVSDHLTQSVIVRFEAQPIGSTEPKFPCLRIGLLKYQESTTAEEIKEAKEVFESLPSKFAEIKQINIGESYTDYPLPAAGITADNGFNLGLIIGCTSVEDLKGLTSKSNSDYMGTMTSTLCKFKQVIVSNLTLA